MTDLRSKIEAVRERIEALRARIDVIESRHVPVTAGEAHDIADRWLSDLVETAHNEIDSVARSALYGRPERPTTSISIVRTPQLVPADLSLPVGIAILSNEAGLRKLLRARIAAHLAEAGEAIPVAKRAELIGKLRADIAAAEREDYRLTEQAIAAGQAIAHRADIDPRVLLGLDDDDDETETDTEEGYAEE